MRCGDEKSPPSNPGPTGECHVKLNHASQSGLIPLTSLGARLRKLAPQFTPFLCVFGFSADGWPLPSEDGTWNQSGETDPAAAAAAVSTSPAGERGELGRGFCGQQRSGCCCCS